MDCIFCKITKGEIPASIIYKDEKITAFHDINPQGPAHVLIVPNVHINKMEDIKKEDQEILGYLLGRVPGIIEKLNLKGKGVRLVCNNNSEAGQTVFHIHFHLIGGRTFGWPPG
ncbi:MAG: histidine triad nucleotide-binding protein [Armatimonadota bacterium]